MWELDTVWVQCPSQSLTWLSLDLVPLTLHCKWRWLLQWLPTMEAQGCGGDVTLVHSTDSQGRNRKGTEKRQLSLLEPHVYNAHRESLGEVSRWQVAGGC